MSSLGVVLTGRLSNQFSLFELCDRTLHLAAMAEQHFKPVEVLVLQVGKDANVDSILGKALRVLLKPKLFEPIRDLLHGCAPATVSVAASRILDHDEETSSWSFRR